MNDNVVNIHRRFSNEVIRKNIEEIAARSRDPSIKEAPNADVRRCQFRALIQLLYDIEVDADEIGVLNSMRRQGVRGWYDFQLEIDSRAHQLFEGQFNE